jgi:hypothetical protein
MSSPDEEKSLPLEITFRTLLREYEDFIESLRQTKIKTEKLEKLKDKLEQLNCVLEKNEKTLELIYEPTLEVMIEILEHPKFLLEVPEHLNLESFKNLFDLHKKLQLLSPEIRDHLFHSFRVFILGIVLFYKNENLRELWEKRIRYRIGQLIEAEMQYASTRKSSKKIIREYLAKNPDLLMKLYGVWIFVSLYHDMGYIIMLLKNKLKESLPQFDFTIKEEQKYKDALVELRKFYSTFLPKPIDRLLELEKCEKKKKEEEHGYLSSVVATIFPQVTRRIDAVRALLLPDYLLIRESIFAIRFHDKPYLSPLSPLLQLLVFTDNIDERERYSLEEKLMSEPISEQLDITDAQVHVTLTFQRDNNYQEYSRKLIRSFKMPKEIREFFEKKKFPELYKKMGMDGIEFKIICCSKEVKSPLVLMFHRDCGRLSIHDLRKIIWQRKIQDLPCKYCSSNSCRSPSSNILKFG